MLQTYLADYTLIFDYFNTKKGTCLIRAKNEKEAYKEANDHIYNTKNNTAYFTIDRIYQPIERDCMNCEKTFETTEKENAEFCINCR